MSKLNGFSPNDCNVLLLGFNGDGKSSSINNMFGEFVAPTNPEQAETKVVTEYAVETRIGASQTPYVLRLIDTPGLVGDWQADIHIVYHIKRYLDWSRKKGRLIDVVLLVVAADNARHHGPQSRYLQVMKIVQSFYGAAERVPVLLVTKADNINAGNHESFKTAFARLDNTLRDMFKETFNIDLTPAGVAVIENGTGEEVVRTKTDFHQMKMGQASPLFAFMQILLHLEESGAPVQASLFQGYFGESTKAKYTRIPTYEFHPETAAGDDTPSTLKRISNTLRALYGIDELKLLCTNNLYPRLDACFEANGLRHDYSITSDKKDVQHFMESLHFQDHYAAGPRT